MMGTVVTGVWRRRTWIVWSVWLAIPLWACGCARKPPRAQVSGEVTYQGTPVPYGDIVFEPVDQWQGFYCQAKIIDGRYAMDTKGPVVGKNRVEIHGYRFTEQIVPDISGKKLDEAPAMTKGLIPYIPPQFNDQSEITVDVVAGENQGMNFHLP